MMAKKNLSIKETFEVAVQNYKKNNFTDAEKICKKVLSIDFNHFDSVSLMALMAAKNRNFDKVNIHDDKAF